MSETSFFFVTVFFSLDLPSIQKLQGFFPFISKEFIQLRGLYDLVVSPTVETKQYTEMSVMGGENRGGNIDDFSSPSPLIL